MRCSPRIIASLIVMGLFAPAHAVYAQALQPQTQIKVYFSPHGGCTEAVVNEINSATQSLDVLAYGFTSPPILKAIREAHDRGVKVQVILDRSNKTAKYSGATYLFNDQVPVWIDTKHAIAHNKVMLIDGKTIITGSFNFTESAETRNAENLLVIHDDPALFQSYTENFRLLMTQAVPYTGTSKDEGTPRSSSRED